MPTDTKEQILRDIRTLISNLDTNLTSENLLPDGVPLELTNSWTDLGGEIDTRKCSQVAVWLQIDVGTSTDVSVRAVGKLSAGGTLEYYLPLKTITSSEVRVEAEYIEFNVDADQNAIVGFEVDHLIPFVQIQVRDAANGDGQIDSAYITKS